MFAQVKDMLIKILFILKQAHAFTIWHFIFIYSVVIFFKSNLGNNVYI